MSFEHRPRPAPVNADVFNPNPSYVPSGHVRPMDALINTQSPVLEPMKGLRTEDFDRAFSVTADTPELHGYDPEKFLRIRSFFLRVALKSPEKMSEKRKDAELLTAKVWNEAAAASISRSPFGNGAVHETEWFKRNGSPDLKLMNRFSRARRIASGVSGHGGIARLQKKAKFIANAEQQPVERAVERAKRNNDTSRNARKNEAFLELTKHHVKHANHEALDRVMGTESAKILRHPIKKVAGTIRNRGKLGNHLVAEGKNNLRGQKLEEIVKAQEQRTAEKAEARAEKQARRAERKDAKQQRREEKRRSRSEERSASTPDVPPVAPSTTERISLVKKRRVTNPPANPASTVFPSIDTATLPVASENDMHAESLGLKNGDILVKLKDGTVVTGGRIVESRSGIVKKPDGTETPSIGYRVEIIVNGAVETRWATAQQLKNWSEPKAPKPTTN